MSTNLIGLIVGGFIPALLFGFCNIASKASVQASIGTGPFLVLTGISVSLIGFVVSLYFGDRTLNTTSGIYAMLFGFLWGSGSAFVVIGLSRYQVPVSKLAPLYNTNTLVTVLLALVIFSEWKSVDVPQLIGGAVLIVFGSLLVSNA
jgi:transporter family protein